MITKQTFTEKAFHLSRKIRDDARLEKQKAADLQHMAEVFASELEGSEQDNGRSFRIRQATSGTRAELAEVLRREAEYVYEVAADESKAKWKFAERNGFYAKMVCSRDALFAKVIKIAEEDLKKVGWTTWESRVDDYLSTRAQAEITNEFVHRMEALCGNMSLGDAAEHALWMTQDDILRNANYGSHRSTSAVQNVAADEQQKARTEILRSGQYAGVKPVRHDV